jgi:hypothetical protein
MKFFAILRDSLRESLDAKVIYALIVMSALAVLASFSISYVPEPGEQGLQIVMGRMPGAVALGGRPPLTYDVEKFVQLNGDRPAWEGKFTYTLVVTENQAADEDDEEKDKGKKRVSFFRMVTLLSLLQEKDLTRLSEEDRKLREKIERQGGDIVGGKAIPNAKEIKKLREVLFRESENLTARQLERFLERMMGESGTLETKEVKLVSQKEGEYRFDVEAVAKPDAVRTWPHEVRFLFGAVPFGRWGVGEFIFLVENYAVNGIGAAIAMLLGSIITAFFIPNMLRKGTVDLLISKPISRWSLLVYKYLGGMLFMLIPTTIVIIGTWAAFGLRSGFWGSGFLLSIPILILQFAIFYALSTLVAVFTRSPILCILVCCGAWLLFFITGWAERLSKPDPGKEKDAGWVYSSSSTVRKLLPRYKDFDTLAGQLVAHDLLGKDSGMRRAVDQEAEGIHWPESLGVTLVYIALLLGVSCWWFSIKDY